MPSATEPRNPMYILLLIVGVLFAVTAFSYAIMPMLEQKALEAGQPLSSSPFRETIRAYGGIALLIELVVVVFLSIGSMVWDRLRTLQKERTQCTIPPAKVEERSR